MLVGWGILSPLSKQYGWAPGPTGDMLTGARGWILWTALAIMCSDSIISLLPIASNYIARLFWYRNFGEEDIKEDHEVETEDRLVPTEWVKFGTMISVLLGVLLVWVVFGDEGIKPWATLCSFVIGAMLSVLGVRALGETDLNPVSGLGKVAQIFFAWIQPENTVANIVAGGVAEAGATQAAELMQDLKTGYLCHVSPRAQFYSQLIGSVASIIVTTIAYDLYTRAFTIPGPLFPAPSAYIWLSFARLLRDGDLPEKTREFMISSAVVFCLVSIFKLYALHRQHSYAKWIPSGVAFAMGMLNTPSFSIARLLGGILEYTYHKRYGKDGNDVRLVILASGFVLGEGVASIVTLFLKTFGVGVASCWGCGYSICPGC